MEHVLVYLVVTIGLYCGIVADRKVCTRDVILFMCEWGAEL